jgi:hypothetical protein
MVDFVSVALLIFMLLVVVINTVFSLKGMKGINNSLTNIMSNLKKLEASGISKEPEKCPKCKKPIDEHTLGEAKKCGLIRTE